MNGSIPTRSARRFVNVPESLSLRLSLSLSLSLSISPFLSLRVHEYGGRAIKIIQCVNVGMQRYLWSARPTVWRMDREM